MYNVINVLECVCVFSLVVAVVVFDEVLQQVNSSFCLYLIDFNQILRQRQIYLTDAGAAQIVMKMFLVIAAAAGEEGDEM